MKRFFALTLCVILLLAAALPCAAEDGYMNLLGYLTQDSVLGTDAVTIKSGEGVKSYPNMVVLIANLRGDASGCRLIGLNDADEPETVDFYNLPEMTVLKAMVILCQNWPTVETWMNEGTTLAMILSADENSQPITITDQRTAQAFALTMVRYLVFD